MLHWRILLLQIASHFCGKAYRSHKFLSLESLGCQWIAQFPSQKPKGYHLMILFENAIQDKTFQMFEKALVLQKSLCIYFDYYPRFGIF